MIKRSIFSLSLLLTTSLVFSQSFPGYRSGNYTGVNGVFHNPANIANNRYRWDVNLVGLGVNVGNSQASFTLSDLDAVFNSEVDSLFFGNSNKASNGIIHTEIIGPSAMLNMGKHSFALSTRMRIFGNIHDIDGNIIQSIDDDNDVLPVTLNSNNNQKIILNAWTEIGGSYGRVLYNKDKHFLKAGITAKYLIGSANSFANINNLKGTLRENLIGEVYLTDASGRVAIGVSGINFDDIEGDDFFSSNGNGLGFDLGVIYEYRPDANSTEYKFKAGLALLDLGSITYKPKSDEFGDYTISIPNGQEWYPSDLNDKSFSEIKSYLDASPYFVNNASSLGTYKSNLPTTLQATFDYAFNKHFFTEVAGQLSLVSNDNAYSPFQYNAVTITPRYEGRRFGFYLPINYNQLTNFNMGFSLRAGPLFLGSGSLLTALIDNSKQADLFFGIRFGGLQKKGKKAE
jgi:hypothetical protein